ncbi:MAG: RES family NAD+ phosphorylase [Chloroflexota bacterium]
MATFEPDGAVLKALADLQPITWSGSVWRHTFADNPPDKVNGRGARWNPPGIDALYVSLERTSALAEADHQIAMQPVRPRAKRTLHRLKLDLSNVLDLTDEGVLRSLGIDRGSLSGVDFTACQRVGGAAAFLGHDGILVPSARHSGVNLVVFVSNQPAESEIRALDAEVIDTGRVDSAG